MSVETYYVWILTLISITSAILIASLWLQYIPAFSADSEISKTTLKKDNGLLYLSLALATWGILGILKLAMNEYHNNLINVVISTFNSVFLLSGYSNLESAAKQIKRNKAEFQVGFILTGVLVIIISWYLDSNELSQYVTLPDFIFSIFTVILFSVTLFKTFVKRRLIILAIFSITTLILVLLAQPYIHFFISDIDSEMILLLGLYARISFIIMICLLAYSWAQRNLSLAEKKISAMESTLLELNNEIAIANKMVQEQKETASQIERDSAWKDVAMKAAHKIGNPIDAVDTLVGRTLKSLNAKDYTKTRKLLESIDESVEEAKHVLSEFRSLNKIGEIKLQTADIAKMIRKICESHSDDEVSVVFINNIEEIIPVSTKTTGDTLSFTSFALREDVQIQIDIKKIKHCFDELLANSKHFLESSEKLITFQLDVLNDLPEFLKQEYSQFLKITYHDNGPGIDEGLKKIIFDPFYTTYTDGTGLGLSIVNKIIELHDGVILENGVFGQGARFEIYLPYRNN